MKLHDTTVEYLSTEYLKNPEGVESQHPRLSWQIQTDSRDFLQSAYEIRVAKNLDALLKKTELVWQTGKVSSIESLHQIYGGIALESGQKYYWQVKVWDSEGNPSNWSEVSFWQMGLLCEHDWKARWVGLDIDYTEPEDDRRKLPARMLRKEFTIDAEKKVVSAMIYISGLGFSELYINGMKANDRIMDPTHSNYDNRVPYIVQNVHHLLIPGKNALGVILGNGRFFSPRLRLPAATPSFGFPKMRMQIQIQYTDGSSDLIVSDKKWKITDQGPIRANSEFDGEEYDATMEQIGWDTVGFDDTHWEPVQLVSAPKGKLRAQMHEPMRVIEELEPVAIYPSNSGGSVVDFGQNFYGMCKINVQGPRGTKIMIRSTFDIDSTGNIDMAPNRSSLSEDLYTLKGEGIETWAPRFRGQGTRYAEITGWPGELKKENIRLLVIHSDLAETGTFSCSNKLVNQIYDSMKRTVRMQERGVPMDPDRDERQAWLSVSEKTSETEGYMYNVAAFYNNFLEETRYSQREDGCLSDAGSIWLWDTRDPCWPAVITSTPWSSYYMYGDKQILADNYPVMKRWVLFLEENLDPDFAYRKGLYGDWVDACSMDSKYPDSGGTSHELLFTAYMYYNLKTVENTANFLEQVDDASYFGALAEKVKKAFITTFFDPESSTFESKTQTSYVLPLAFGLVPEEHMESVIRNLVDDIMVKNNGHLSVGCPGLKWLMQTLTAVGHTDVAYTILTQTTRPSWGYMCSKGATSIWERWDRDTREPGMNGQSQTILAGYLGAWMYQALAGIAYDTKQPGFRNIIMRPEPVGDLSSVNSSFKSVYGLIVSDWKCENGLFEWKVIVPPNCSAEVHIPTNDVSSIKESAKSIEDNENFNCFRVVDNVGICSIGSGEYSFSASHSLLISQ